MKFQEKKLEASYLSIAILRVMLSLIFIVASLSHLFNMDKTVERIESAKLGFIGNVLVTPEISVVLSGVVMLVAGISLLVGYKPKQASAILILVLIPITLTIQVGQMSSIGPLFKNIAIFGGLLFFALNPNPKFKKQ